MDAHLPYQRSVLPFFALVADQVGVRISCLHCAVDPIEHSLERTVLVVVSVANVEGSNPSGPTEPFSHREGFVENL
ncbi:MAG: hypothetical protein AAGA71_06200 [Pseudomonadota bacterium]